MLNKNIILVVTFSLIVGLVLAGCGAQSTPETLATQVPPAQPVDGSTPQPAPTETVKLAPTDAPAQALTDIPTDASTATVSFANDVMPIIQSRCINCHGGQRVEKGLKLDSYADVMAGSENGPVVVPGDAANSQLVELIVNQKMPKRGSIPR